MRTDKIPDDYVALGRHYCKVCLTEHDSGEVLIHKQLRSIPTNKRVTGWGLCPDCKGLRERGFVALIGVLNKGEGSRLKPEEATRSGDILHIRDEAFANIFNCPVPAEYIAFVDVEAVETLKKMMGQAPG